MRRRNVIILCAGLVAATRGEAAAGALAARAAAPVAAHDDLESWAEAAVEPGLATRNLRLTLSLDAQGDCGAEAAFTAGPGGALSSPGGTALVMGFDCGEWFVCGDLLRRRFSAAAAGPEAPGRRSLTARVTLDARGVPMGVSFVEELGGARSGVNLGEVPAAWFAPQGWAFVRAVSRGGAAGVSASVGFVPDGTVMILR